ncbi:MAG: ABC transporter ATP-binding protein [Alphaproteobacteria bacterium]|nr:ABC transporter ATP-binding protein [Alphaproteobacteria bacterium]
MARIVLDNLVKRYGDDEAVRGVTLAIENGEFTVLVGPSGCGKTTTLRMIAGLEEVTSGNIRFDNESVENLPPKARDVAMVFQSYALYPHMSARKNMAFSLRMKGVSRAEQERLVQSAAELLNITALLDRKPRELSGGQRQRVAMGRAIVRNPRAFLFDEPLSNLDAALRAQMRIEIKKIHQKLQATIVYVTHDQVEAMTLADKIVVMRDGRFEQVGDPVEVYQHPTNKFVAGFIGSPRMNFIPARLVAENGALSAELRDGTVLPVPRGRWPAYRPYADQAVEIGLRPDHLTDRQETNAPSCHFLDATIDVIEPTGATSLITFSIDGIEFAAIADSGVPRRPGDRIRLRADMSHMHLIDLASEKVIAPDCSTA